MRVIFLWEGIFTMNKTNFTKRIISISAAAVCMLSALRIADLNDMNVVSDIDANAAGTLTAFEITEEMQIGWNLGNTLDAYKSVGTTVVESAGLETETCWGVPAATQQLFDAIKAKGFNTVRIPTTWFQHLDGDNNIDAQWMARVHEVVDYAYKQGMYVILNVHHENWIDRADIGTAYDEMRPKLMKIWTQIATEFKDYDQHLIFESMNEPRAKGTTHEWWGPEQNEVDTINKLNADFVQLIRSLDSPYASTRLLMIPSYCAASDTSIISRTVVPDDDYVAVSVHAYVPYDFTMNAEVSDHSTFTAAYSDSLATTLEGIRKTFIAKDIPVVIGEFGTSNFNNTEARVQWANQYISTAKEIGIPCVLWDNNILSSTTSPGECHGYINRSNGEWYAETVPVVDEMMKVLADDSIPWGGEKAGKTYNHEDINSGLTILDTAVDLDSALSKTGGNCTPGLNATWGQLENNEVAVKFTGGEPVIAITDGEWDNWTEVKAYDVDETNGIAYFSAEHIKSAWESAGLDVTSIEHLFARTNSTTTVSQVSILGYSGEVPTQPEDKTKKYNIELPSGSKSGMFVMADFTGTAGTTTNGCIGYMNDADWENVEWEGTIGSDGKLQVIIPISAIPDSVTAGEIQIWWSDDDSPELVNYSVYGTGDVEPTTEPETTTTVSSETKYGDANEDNKINMADAVAVLQNLANDSKYPLSAKGAINADCDGDAGLTGTDAITILRVEAGEIEQSALPLKK